VIYKIESKSGDDDKVYIGWTTKLKSRITKMKNNYNNENSEMYNIKLNKYIRENGGWNNYNFVVIKKFGCESKAEANKEKANVMKLYNHDNLLNTTIPNRTKAEYSKEYYLKNKQKFNDTSKKYYEKNKQKLINYQKKYDKLNAEKIAEYQSKYKKIWYEKNNEIVECECGKAIVKANLNTHKKTQSHNNIMNKLKMISNDDSDFDEINEKIKSVNNKLKFKKQQLQQNILN